LAPGKPGFHRSRRSFLEYFDQEGLLEHGIRIAVRSSVVGRACRVSRVLIRFSVASSARSWKELYGVTMRYYSKALIFRCDWSVFKKLSRGVITPFVNSYSYLPNLPLYAVDSVREETQNLKAR
jgi:hypothetical protein